MVEPQIVVLVVAGSSPVGHPASQAAKVLLFGAGASFGSQRSVPVPPLSANLFDGLVCFAPRTWGSLPAPWPSQFRADFEAAMSSYIDTGAFGAPLQWDMATYFFTQFAATPSSTYVKLLAALAPRISEYLFVTLNYELLLFQAKSIAGIPADRFRVCLPHGNACLCCSGVSATAGVSFTGGVSTGGSVRVFRDRTDFMSERTANVFPPVMSYYEPKKFTVSCANFIQDQRAQFEQEVLAADKVAIVGARVHVVDQHIWGPLAKTKAKLLYLSGATDAPTFTAWSSGQSRSSDIAVPKYFDDGVADLRRIPDVNLCRVNFTQQR
jgi:hypothetical protein